ncbi:cytochrome c-type biogenesis protein CcmE [Janthinobacterium sp. Marseille]|uniref:Cytochrome c-type biogenesis protein CcmE n=2 Tax=Oxalobacteraceae TaxID=75682 RepID=CCME_JANMA|nr:cytochrome c maturation protein CcmE [Janthinobacterium sp. Marseille]A6SWI5.1 RecName: Full=Cytochrome c-type biogenesis protein CcmE; AltName: Full=Cytochrome c maturation protein E; AltName: Full=Heme chaperone CcmE [Janthinobacterium sp. Marseille]ABR89200.1 cytochrome c-type biogenesis protein CcmE [Janthinobacterium sp. Marseille]
MNPIRKKRLYWILALLCGVSIAMALALSALQENINLFYTPSQIVAGEAPQGTRIRAGGMVENGSLMRTQDSLALRFSVTDGAHNITVRYQGILPDLFREGQGIVAMGKLDRNGSLIADEVLAKHDENYMPPEVIHALKQAGVLDNPKRVKQESTR